METDLIGLVCVEQWKDQENWHGAAMSLKLFSFLIRPVLKLNTQNLINRDYKTTAI